MNTEVTNNPIARIFSSRFPLGQIVITPTALNQLDPADRLESLARHAQADWGECSPDDRNENDLSLELGLRLFSVYTDRNKTRFWIITEADRSVTTILLPSDY